MKRGLSLAGVFLLAALSSASFELVLGIDETNMQIDRFDGVTGAYLGSFAKGVTGGGGALAIDQSKGLCYNNNFLNRTIQVWNYNTGEFVNEYATTNTLRGLAINNAGELLLGTTNGIQRVNPSTGAVIATYFGSVSFSGVEQAPDGSYVAVNISNNTLVKYDSNFVQTGGAPFGMGTASAIQWQIAFAGTQGYATNNDAVVQFSVSGSAPDLGTSYNPASIERVLGVGVGHASRRYAAGRTPSTNLPAIHAFSDVGGGGYVSHITFSRPGAATGYYDSIAVVVAPEPSTIMGFAVGLALLARRRRARG
jgi:hypothetical protein